MYMHMYMHMYMSGRDVLRQWLRDNFTDAMLERARASGWTQLEKKAPALAKNEVVPVSKSSAKRKKQA